MKSEKGLETGSIRGKGAPWGCAAKLPREGQTKVGWTKCVQTKRVRKRDPESQRMSRRERATQTGRRSNQEARRRLWGRQSPLQTCSSAYRNRERLAAESHEAPPCPAWTPLPSALQGPARWLKVTLPLPFSSFPHLQLELRERTGEDGQTEREAGRATEAAVLTPLMTGPLQTSPSLLWASVYPIQTRWDLLVP